MEACDDRVEKVAHPRVTGKARLARVCQAHKHSIPQPIEVYGVEPQRLLDTLCRLECAL